ncbi:CDGSH iron-sulfur domain-containing protein [Flavobacterium agrisoli]|uniref:CDGSH iron-sulfur domain-containing protein n=1 Tax=Flavobacterium agrisoli TaxID=2793066 RepID=UPI0037443557
MSKTKLIINDRGSIRIDGDFEIMDHEGKIYGLEGRTALGLCRCGHSVKNLLEMEHIELTSNT